MLTQILKVTKVITNNILSIILVKVIKTQDTRKYKYGGDSYDTAYQKVNQWFLVNPRNFDPRKILHGALNQYVWIIDHVVKQTFWINQ